VNLFRLKISIRNFPHVCVLKLLIEGKLLIHFVTQPSVFLFCEKSASVRTCICRFSSFAIDSNSIFINREALCPYRETLCPYCERLYYFKGVIKRERNSRVSESHRIHCVVAFCSRVS